MKIAQVSEMRHLDKTAIQRYGIAGPILMENAGEAVYYVILEKLGSVAGLDAIVVCGSGHNGGDGLVVARKFYSMGAQVRVFCLGKPEKFDDVVRPFYEMVQKIGIPFSLVHEDADVAALADALSDADVVVDAVFGTGLDRNVGGRYAKAIALINESAGVVFSVDIPSGIHGDTGQVMGVAVRADATITFGLPKPGSLIYPGYEYGGDLTVTHISFPPELYTSSDLQLAVSPFPPLPRRPGDAHKGSVGKVMAVAGASRYLGAPYFAAMAFLRAGGGLSYLATPESVAPFIAARGNEIVFLPQKATDSGSLALENLDGILAASEEMAMVTIGSGISLDPETQHLARELIRQIQKPLLVDGDGLTALVGHREMLRTRTEPTVLTPHPGELARLLGVTPGAVQRDRVAAARKAATAWQVTVVLKGAHTLIAHPDGRVFFNLSGNAGMATAGSGDVLTGVIAGMYAALHFDFEDAVRMGVFIHGVAGDLAADALGEEGMVAGDILARAPEAVQLYQDFREEIIADFYGKIAVI